MSGANWAHVLPRDDNLVFLILTSLTTVSNMTDKYTVVMTEVLN